MGIKILGFYEIIEALKFWVSIHMVLILPILITYMIIRLFGQEAPDRWW